MGEVLLQLLLVPPATGGPGGLEEPTEGNVNSVLDTNLLCSLAVVPRTEECVVLATLANDVSTMVIGKCSTCTEFVSAGCLAISLKSQQTSRILGLFSGIADQHF